METLLLPGMDGTGRLFSRLLPLLDPALGARVVSYPVDRRLGYAELLAELAVPSGPFCVIAESFSGPLGVLLARRYEERVLGLVLAASFVTSPAPLVARVATAAGSLLFALPLPDLALRAAMVGMDADEDDLRELRAAMESVRPDVVAHRIGEVARVDVTREFSACVTPTLYIAGAHDRLVGSRTVKRLQIVRPGMELRVLDAPHLVLQRAAAEAASVANAFLMPRLDARPPRG